MRDPLFDIILLNSWNQPSNQKLVRQTTSSTIYTGAMTPAQLLAKRLLDILMATAGILLTLPVMLLVAVAIKLDSKWDVIFRQQRVGMGGKRFTMYKFRSMCVNAEALQSSVNEVAADGHIIHKKRNDPRVTRIGRIIRKTSLDELPQLFNVLKGDMSIVGPRPELTWLVDQYNGTQRRRLEVPQGITGWWQVNGRSDALMHLNSDQDIYYIENYSLWLDIKIILMTVPVLLMQKGAF